MPVVSLGNSTLKNTFVYSMHGLSLDPLLQQCSTMMSTAIGWLSVYQYIHF